MQWKNALSSLFLILTISIASTKPQNPFLNTPKVILRSIPFNATIRFPPLKNGSVYPAILYYRVEFSDGELIHNNTIHTIDADGNFQSRIEIPIAKMTISRLGTQKLITTIHRVHPESQSIHRPEPKYSRSNASIAHVPQPNAIPNVQALPAGKGVLNTTAAQSFELEKSLEILSSETSVFVSPGWVSLLPPLVTLVMSAVLNEVILALLMGIWCGASIVSHGNVLTGFLRTFDEYWVNAFMVDGHAGVLLFTIILGGTIGIVQKGGGAHGLAFLAQKYMTSPLRMQFATWALCLTIFFDDFSCILIIGSSLRQVLTQTGVSREKFAAIVHTLGVCLPSMAPVSSWIGVEIGYIAAQLHSLGLHWDPFLTCLSCLHYRFFPILFIGFIFITIICQKDFAGMVQFEKDAAASPLQTHHLSPAFGTAEPEDSPKEQPGPVEPDPQKPMRWQNAVIPFTFIVIATFLGMIIDGASRILHDDPKQKYTVLDALSACNSVSALIRASSGGWLVASLLLRFQRILTLDELAKAWAEGTKDVLNPLIVLLLAWALGNVITEINVASYIASSLGKQVRSEYLSSLAAIFCYVVSFATGSAFGTMAIMFPIISPLAYEISGGDSEVLMQCFGSILGSSVFGNICSPIADTSILVSLSTQVRLDNHIRSILPYALLVGIVSIVGGSLPISFRILSTFSAFILSFAALLLIVFFCGTRVNRRYRAMSSCSLDTISPSSIATPPPETLREDIYSGSKANTNVNPHAQLLSPIMASPSQSQSLHEEAYGRNGSYSSIPAFRELPYDSSRGENADETSALLPRA
uniref:NhaC Na:H antiporter (NhaC) family protein putative n=1 Tax=Albugo laibachii Nc14 TaxID=890382 RepID=F0W112_9STRA|nr:NhaC Na:H antiporter (NhaC) family protein putative [Albugo laibachii Nc14]|eukprot:CCA14736.1 NhaC Na:H antiporter (NhaC) family protein putative [Albugo laibachii Nc14]